jgi:DNA repair protein RadC
MSNDLRERLNHNGANALAIHELLAIILRVGGVVGDAQHLAQSLLQQAGGLRKLARLDYAELVNQYGLRPAQAAQVVAALELGRRLMNELEPERPVIQTAEDAARLLMLDMERLRQEQLRVILLDAHRRVIAIPIVYIGSLNMTVIRTAEVFREAIARNAPSLILVHNHPSGDPTPSPSDLDLTESLVAAGRLLDIAVLDHLVIGHGRWVSLRDTGAVF